MKLIGLTGGIAAGKSTVCKLFESLYNVPIFDADKVVHRIYQNKNVIEGIGYCAPEAIVNATIDRQKLAAEISKDPDLLEEIEDLIYPLVRTQELNFIRNKFSFGCDIIFSEIPLLFEVGAQSRYDAVIVVHAPLVLRKKRAMKRVNMNEKKWRTITERQLSDEKRLKYADYVINTAIGRAETAKQVKQIMQKIRG